jgi:signal transduction histidine kinase
VAALGDHALLEVAMGKLLANALKYGAKRPVSLHVGRRGARAFMAIRDRGVGISLERQGSLFDRFSRRGLSTRQYGGLGLGLWTVRAIAEAHGGAVRVISQEGQGATFEVDLPATELASAPQSA